MAEIAIRELKNNLSEIVRQAEAGTRYTVTVGRRAVAELGPIRARRRWIPVREAESLIGDARADPGLAAELNDLVGDTVDEL